MSDVYPGGSIINTFKPEQGKVRVVLRVNGIPVSVRGFLEALMQMRAELVIEEANRVQRARLERLLETVDRLLRRCDDGDI